MGAHQADPGELDVAPIVAETDCAGGETTAQTGTAPLNRGNATRRPAGAPALDFDQFDNVVARLASPEEYASLLLSAHHGARWLLAWFHARHLSLIW